MGMDTMTDAELVAAYAKNGDDAAFAEIVSRHGSMVYRVCHSYVHDSHEAEDCSQAVFLVLVRKASTLGKNPNLACWLHGVARRISLGALRSRRNRTKREEQAAMEQQIEPELTPDQQAAVMEILYEELSELSSLQRQAVLLRHLEGHSEKRAAAIAGCSPSALGTRAHNGIARLRKRLSRRGAAVSLTALLAALAAETQAAGPTTLLPSLLAVSKGAAAGAAAGTAGTVSASTTALAEGAIKMMIWSKVKMATAVVAGVVILSAVPFILVSSLADEQKPAAAATQSKKAGGDKLGKSSKKGTTAPYFTFRDGLYRVKGNTVKKVATVDRDAFLAPGGLVSFVTDKQKLPKDHESMNLRLLADYDEGTGVEVRRVNPKGELDLVCRFDMPKKRKAKTTALAGGILFVTGPPPRHSEFERREKAGLPNHILWMADTRKGKDAKLVPVKVPEKVKHKAFDDLLVDGKTLIAVDDMFEPKWIVVYDISNPAAPKVTAVDNFRTEMNQSVIRGAVGPNYLALFCASNHQGGRERSLSIYDKSKKFARLTDIELWTWDRMTEKTTGQKCNPILSFSGDLLIVSKYGKGVGAVDCAKGKKLKQLVLRAKGKNQEDRTVIDAVALPSSNKVVVWLKEGGDGTIVDAAALGTRAMK